MPQASLKVQPMAAVPHDAAELSLTWNSDTPVFCFSAKALEARARVFLDGFKGDVTFAVKSCPATEVIETLAGLGIASWDVASVQEMKLVHAVQPEAHFHYHNLRENRHQRLMF